MSGSGDAFSIFLYLGGCAEPGARALVPVGRRQVTGIILGTAAGPPDGGVEVKDVVELRYAEPVIPPELP